MCQVKAYQKFETKLAAKQIWGGLIIVLDNQIGRYEIEVYFFGYGIDSSRFIL